MTAEAAQVGVAVPGDLVFHTTRVGGCRGAAVPNIVRYRVTSVIGCWVYLQTRAGVRSKVSTWALRHRDSWSVQPQIPGILGSVN